MTRYAKNVEGAMAPLASPSNTYASFI